MSISFGKRMRHARAADVPIPVPADDILVDRLYEDAALAGALKRRQTSVVEAWRAVDELDLLDLDTAVREYYR